MMLMAPVGKIYLASTFVDLRKSYQTLGLHVKSVLKGNPLTGDFFIFYNRRHDLIKILYWQTNGFCLWQKRIEDSTFKIPKDLGELKLELTSYQLHGLVQGLDWMNQAEKVLHYRLVS
jgi:transposase